MVMQTKQSLYILLSVDADRLHRAFSKHDRFQKQNHSMKLNWTHLFDIKGQVIWKVKIPQCIKSACMYLLMINILCVISWIYIALHSCKTMQLSPHERKWHLHLLLAFCTCASTYVHLSLSWGCIWFKRTAFVKNVRMKNFYLADWQKFLFGSVATIQQQRELTTHSQNGSRLGFFPHVYVAAVVKYHNVCHKH